MMENPLIYKKIAAVLADSDAISKDRTNSQQGFKFRGIDDVYNSLHPILAKHGVFSTTEVLEERTEERQTQKGGTLIYRILKVKFKFFAEDGSFIESVIIGEGMDSGDKASNKAMAIAHKYALLQLLAIPTEDAKDPDAESHELAPKVSTIPQRDEPKAMDAGYMTPDYKTESIAMIKQLGITGKLIEGMFAAHGGTKIGEKTWEGIHWKELHEELKHRLELAKGMPANDEVLF